MEARLFRRDTRATKGLDRASLAGLGEVERRSPREENIMRWLRRAARAVARAVFFCLVVLLAALPVPVMPIVFVFQKWRNREVAAEVDRKP
ncbi:Hypothetical protein A7982_10315 [Minicystis rosea]|nr:Hypothetical protein A7982_10315 [Minicystis rosea]